MVGTQCRVLAIREADEISVRLLEMGVTPGVEISVVGCAPLGDPIEIEVRGYLLSIRKSEAARVEIEVDENSPSPKHVS
jgi:ferrous iron transport protein A